MLLNVLTTWRNLPDSEHEQAISKNKVQIIFDGQDHETPLQNISEVDHEELSGYISVPKRHAWYLHSYLE